MTLKIECDSKDPIVLNALAEAMQKIAQGRAKGPKPAPIDQMGQSASSAPEPSGSTASTSQSAPLAPVEGAPSVTGSGLIGAEELPTPPGLEGIEGPEDLTSTPPAPGTPEHAHNVESFGQDEDESFANAGESLFNAPAPEAEPSRWDGGTLDGRGFPWDARIHSSAKEKLAKKPHGWKPLRVPKALVEQHGGDKDAAKAAFTALTTQIETEMMAAGFGVSGPASAPPPPATAAASQEATPATAPPPPAASTGNAPPPPAEAAPINLPALMKGIRENKVDDAALQDVLGAYGITSLALLAKPEHRDKIGEIATALGVA